MKRRSNSELNLYETLLKGEVKLCLKGKMVEKYGEIMDFYAEQHAEDGDLVNMINFFKCIVKDGLDWEEAKLKANMTEAQMECFSGTWNKFKSNFECMANDKSTRFYKNFYARHKKIAKIIKSGNGENLIKQSGRNSQECLNILNIPFDVLFSNDK